MKKKIIAILAAVVILIGAAAIYVVNMPEFMLLNMAQDVKKDGFTAIEPYLTGNLKPMFQTVVKLSKQPWLVNLIQSDTVQGLFSMMTSSEEGSMSWELEDVRRGSKSASVLVNVKGASFEAQVSLELVRQDGDWLIDSLSLPSFDLNKK